MEPQLEDVVMELAAEAPLVAVFPLLVHDLEGDVLVGRPGGDAEDDEFPVGSRRHLEGGRLALVDQVRVEDVELVALDDLGRGVVEVVVGLVVLVPLEAGVHSVEVAGLPGSAN